MKLSAHFTLEEMTFSETAARRGIDNTPQQEQITELVRLCTFLLEPIREMFGKPIIVTSGFRSGTLNMSIGGSRMSEHMDGRAADFRVPGMTPYEVCLKLAASEDLPYNQLIQEFGSWTHISVAEVGKIPKRETLTAVRGDLGRTVYLPGLHESVK